MASKGRKWVVETESGWWGTGNGQWSPKTSSVGLETGHRHVVLASSMSVFEKIYKINEKKA